MLQFRTINRLANLLQAISEAEQKSEVIKQVLAEQRHFEPLSAFRRLDQTKTGQLSASDLIDFLEQNKIIITYKEAVILLRFLDANKDGKLTYSDFSENILPHQDARLKQIAILREAYYLQEGDPLPYEAEWSLARVFEQEVKNQRNLESLKDILVSSYDFSNLDIFNIVDDLKQGSLSPQTVDSFLRNQGKTLNQEQLFALFTRVGSATTNVITYPQFIEIITPSDPSVTQGGNKTRFGSSQIKGDSISSKLGASRAIQDAEIDNEYSKYLAKSSSPGKLKPNPSKSNLQSQQGSQQGNQSPNKKSNQTSSSTVRYPTSQRSPYYQPNKDLNTLQQTINAPINNKMMASGTISNIKLQISKMKGNEEEHLVRALKEQVVIERDLEELKSQLTFRNDFNVEDGFRIFDKKGRGYLSKFEFEISLNDIGLYPSKDELHLFFQRYDRDNDGLLKFSDFSDFVTPYSQEGAALSKSKVPNYLNPDNGLNNFSIETRRLYKKLLNKIFQSEIEGEYIRQKLANRPLFSLYDAFLAIDNEDNGFVTHEEFRNILQDYGVFVSGKDLASLVKRYDKNQDNRVTFIEFMSELTPKSPVKQF